MNYPNKLPGLWEPEIVYKTFCTLFALAILAGAIAGVVMIVSSIGLINLAALVIIIAGVVGLLRWGKK